MKKYQKGDRLKVGFYMNLSKGELVQVDSIDSLLPLSTEDKFVKIPSVLAILGAPVIGLAYVIFLPLTGICAIFVFLGMRLRSLFAMGSHKNMVRNAGTYSDKGAGD